MPLYMLKATKGGICSLEVLEVPEVMGGLCLPVVLDVLEVMRCVLLYMLKAMRALALFAGGVGGTGGDALCAALLAGSGGDGGDALCATLYAGRDAAGGGDGFFAAAVEELEDAAAELWDEVTQLSPRLLQPALTASLSPLRSMRGHFSSSFFLAFFPAHIPALLWVRFRSHCPELRLHRGHNR